MTATWTALDWALAYAAAGWPVFPHTGEPHTWGARVRWWTARATIDPTQIRRWWTPTLHRRRCRPAGVGISTGPAGLVVVETAPSGPGEWQTGAEALTQLQHDHSQRLPATWTIAGPGQRRHLYYHQPPGHELGCTRELVGPGINTWGQGGAIPAPPTRETTGEWWVIDEHEPVELPAWFAALLTSSPPPPVPPVSPAAIPSRCQ